MFRVDRLLLRKKMLSNFCALVYFLYCWSFAALLIGAISRSSAETIKYRGCYQVRSKSSLLNDGISNNSTLHTPDTCIQFCRQKNFPFAGVEKYECRCGHHVPSDLLKRSSGECNYACHGSNHKTFKCGAKSKVSIYETGIKPVDSIPSRIYLGCFKDANPEFRVLEGSWNEFPSDNSPKKCHSTCFGSGFRYFGLTNQKECFCGDTIPSLDDRLPESECSSQCSGNPNEVCGGGWRLSLYATGITDYPENGRFMGCLKNLRSSEFKPEHKFELPKSITNRRCLNMCSFKGFKYSGVENRTTCGCTNTAPLRFFMDDPHNCDKYECLGDPTETCGATDRVKIYQTRHGDIGLVEEAVYMGCYEDRTDFRVMDAHQVVSIDADLTPRLCVDICKNKGYAFSGLEAGKECFCGHTYPSPSLRSSADDCTIPCEKNPNEKCGGLLRLSVYQTGLPHNHAQVSRVYMGCYKDDDKDNRLLKGSWQQLENNSPDVCHKLCLKTGFLYFGLTWIKECFCGDAEPPADQLLSDEECNKECSGDSNQKCGAGWKTTIYKTGLEELPDQNEYLGCFQNDGDLLQDYSVLLLDSNTPKRCVRICDQMGYIYAGVEKGDRCRCGNEPSKYLSDDDTSCDLNICPGSETETCGGNNFVKMYRTTVEVMQTTSIFHQTHVGNCKASETTKNGKSACKNDVLLDERFDTLNSSKWKHTVKMGSDPDYEFVTYSSSSNVTFVKNGILHIRPMLQPDNYVYGKENLVGCTGIPHSDECKKTAVAFSILPPVLSAQITTARSFSFRFGRVDIRAKFPSGDWIVPQIWLTPKDSIYGPKYASGQIRIAYAFGNKNLQCDQTNLGSRVLQSGVVLGPSNFVGNILSRNESTKEWSNHFHNYSLIWTTDNLSFHVDGKFVSKLLNHPSDTIVSAAQLPHSSRYLWQDGSRMAPFDKEFYITLGVSVGGIRDFSDTCLSNEKKKPWSDTSPKAMLTFWENRSEWKATWSDADSALQVDHITVVAI